MKYNPDIFLAAAELLDQFPPVEFSCNAIGFVGQCQYGSSWKTIRRPEVDICEASRHRFYYCRLMSPRGDGRLFVDDFDPKPLSHGREDPKIMSHRIFALLWAATVCNEVEI